ncbi:MAG TPA: hypothetical protein VFB58_08640 [Chloroflexota bacterium]|nr:hypothetical protein [Chloroflexota bacterium]
MTAQTPLVYRPEAFTRIYVEDDAELRRVATALEGAATLGVDVEMGQRVLRKPGGVQEWRHILALVQIAADDLSVIVDPLRCSTLAPLAPVMSGPSRKVLLGGGQDATMLGSAGIPVRNIADVGEVAYAIFGRREDGMAALARRIFGLELDKTVRRTDWLVRPLPRHLIAYAFQDAELTLLIYRWFQENYANILALHERLELEPEIPQSLPVWLRDALLRGAGDPAYLLAEHDLSVERDGAAMEAAIRAALLLYANAPRRLNRLLRISGDLGLVSLLPSITPYTHSPSSLLRASAARSIGKLAEKGPGKEALQPLLQDPIEDVRKAAQAAIKDLNAPKRAEPEPETLPTLDDETMSQLRELMERLSADE